MEDRTSSAWKNDELQLLDGLGTDFSYLRRFILAAQQIARMSRTESARSDFNLQEKLIGTIEIAKETLTEAGICVRPFVPCPANLLPHKEAYLDMLNEVRDLVPYVKDAETRLRLRRLLLPLSSTSRFKVSLHNADEICNVGKAHGALPTVNSAAPSNNVEQRVESLAEQNGSSKRLKLTSGAPQRINGAVRSATPGPSSPPATAQHLQSQPAAITPLPNKQRRRAGAISCDVSQRVLVRRATQTVRNRPSTSQPPIDVDSPTPALSSSPTSSPSPSPSPPPSSSPPPTTVGKPPQQTSPTPYICYSPPPSNPAPIRNFGPGYEAYKRSVDYKWSIQNPCEQYHNLPDVPPHIKLGGSWADLPIVHPDDPIDIPPSHMKTGPGLTGPVSWVLENTAPPMGVLEQRGGFVEDSSCIIV